LCYMNAAVTVQHYAIMHHAGLTRTAAVSVVSDGAD
jgi:hypothetical protein